MRLETASLIIRLDLSLAESGGNFRDPKPFDEAAMAKAFKVAGYLFDVHELELYGVIDENTRIRSCPECRACLPLPHVSGGPR